MFGEKGVREGCAWLLWQTRGPLGCSARGCKSETDRRAKKVKRKKARTKHIQTQVINEFSQGCGNSWLKGSLNQDGFWEHQGGKKKEKP